MRQNGGSTIRTFRDRVRTEDAGEGVISAAIVVLIMAVIGGAMFVVFSDAFGGASERITEEIGTIVESSGR
jgi:hypothetical protein